MALQDCITKMERVGVVVSEDDIAALTKYLADGLTDGQAVRKLYLQSQKNVFDIVDRAQKEGGDVAPSPNPITDLVNMQSRLLTKLQKEQDKLFNEKDTLKRDLGEIYLVEDRVEEFKRFVGQFDDDGNFLEADLLDALTAMLFDDRDDLALGITFLQGTTPLELMESYESLMAMKEHINERLPKVNNKIRALNDRVSAIFHGMPGQQELFRDDSMLDEDGNYRPTPPKPKGAKETPVYYGSAFFEGFKAAAKLGRMHQAKPGWKPSKAEEGLNSVELGRLNGYSEDDIAHFYLMRRGGHEEIAYQEYVADRIEAGDVIPREALLEVFSITPEAAVAKYSKVKPDTSGTLVLVDTPERSDMPVAGDLILTEDGFNFEVLESGEVTDGDMSWPTVQEFVDSMANNPEGPIGWLIEVYASSVREDSWNYSFTSDPVPTEIPWKIKSRGEGDLYIRRHGKNAGMPFKERQGPNDFAISFGEALNPQFMFYLLQHLQSEIAELARGTAQQAIRISDINDVLVRHFKNQASEQQDMFAEPGVSVATRAVEAGANYKLIVHLEQRGTLETGITKVEHSADAAHVMAPIRRNAQEGVWALILDADNNVLSVHEHTKGGIGNSAVYASAFVGAILNTPGAAKVWLSHNHPSGGLDPSQDDMDFTKGISRIMSGSEVQLMGHVLLAGGQGRYVEMSPRGQIRGAPINIKPAVRKETVPITTRVFRGKPTIGSDKISNPFEAMRVVRDLGNPDGVVMLDHQHRVIGFMAMTTDEMKQLKGTGQSSRLLRALSQVNAGAFLVSYNGLDAVAASNMMSFGNLGEIKMLDYIYKDANGNTVSAGQQGQIVTGQTFLHEQLGLTSGLLTGARTMPQAKGPAAQMLATLKKQPGVTLEELEWVGVPEWMADQGTVTQDDLVAFIQANGIQVDETMYGDDSTINANDLVFTSVHREKYPQLNVSREEFEGPVDVFEVALPGLQETYLVVHDIDGMESQVINPEGNLIDHSDTAVGAPLLDARQTIAEDIALWANLSFSSFDGEPQHHTRTLDGGTNYREAIMSLPTVDIFNHYTGSVIITPADPMLSRTEALGAGGPVEQDDEVMLNYEDMDIINLEAFLEDIEETFALDLAMASTGEGQFDYSPAEKDLGIDFSSITHDQLTSLRVVAARHNAEVMTMSVDKKRPGMTENAFDSHYGDIKNKVVWFRINDRRGPITAEHPNGAKIMHIEEIQAPHHQRAQGKDEEGVKKGYRTKALKEEIKEAFNIGWALGGPAIRAMQRNEDLGFDSTADAMMEVLRHDDWQARWDVHDLDDIAAIRDWREAREKEAELRKRSSEAEPDMPFKGTAWIELAMKRIIRLAAEGDYDQITWTTGQQQADRYNLSQVINRIEVLTRRSAPSRQVSGKAVYLHRNEAGGIIRLGVNKDGIIDDAVDRIALRWVGKPLAEVIGKEMAEKVMAKEVVGDENEETNFRDEDFKVGGEGKKEMYDKVFLNVMNKVTRKLDKSSKARRFGQRLPDAGPLIQREELATQLNDWLEQQEHFDTAMEAADARGDDVATQDLVERWIEAGDKVDELQEQMNALEPVVHVLDITDQMRKQAIEGQTLMQSKRASITFDDAHRAIIRIGQTRNWDSFLHESGHLYLVLMRDLARMDGAPQQIKDDFKAMLKFLGVDTWEQVERKHHEHWARSFSAYLREGKAPSLELQEAFSAYRSWLMVIYDTIRKLLRPGEDLNDEIRGVMDRIMASDEAIKEAERVQEYAAFFASAEDMGVSPEAFQLYKDSLVKVHNDAVDDEVARLLAGMQRQAKAAWDDARKGVVEEVSAEAYELPIYKALAMLQRGTNPDGSAVSGTAFKLDRDDLIERFGVDFIKRLPKPWVYAAKNGVDADVAASIFGFGNAKDMVQALIQAPKMDAWIQAETDRRMEARFPDPLMDGSMVESAIRAVHGEGRAQIIVAELKALGRLVRADQKVVAATKKEAKREDREALEANKGQMPTRHSLAVIKATAQQIVGRLKIRNLKPNAYLTAERKAARAAHRAWEKKDYQTAYAEKLKQIHNIELYRAALKAEKATGSTHKYLKKFDSPRVQIRLGKAGVLDSILSVLDGIDLRKVSMAQEDREIAMAEILAMVDEGSLIVPPQILAKLSDRGTNWQSLTVEEFQGIRDIVKQLEHQAKANLEYNVNGEVVVLKDAVDEIVSSITENNKAVVVGVAEKTRGEERKKGGKSVVAHWLRPGSMARILDDAGFGALTRRLILPIRRAYTERLVPMLKKARLDVTALYLNYYSNEELRALKKGAKDFAVINGEAMSKSDVLSIALNWGNESNRSALLQGIKLDGEPAYTEQGIRQALASLSAKDYAFVQAVWDYIDTYWPQLSAAEKSRRGIAPSKVEAAPFTIRTSDGQTITMKGGYYPLAYNAEHSDRVKSMEVQDHYKKMGNGTYVSAATRAGATHERVKKHGHVVKLGLNLIDRHLREVIRDISIGDEINFVKTLLNNSDVRNAFKSTNNSVALDEMSLWLTDAAVGELPAIDALERWVNYSRIGFTVSKLAYNVMTTALQLTGTFQTIAVIGGEAFAHGVGKFLQNPVQMYKWVLDNSHFMSMRYKEGTWDKDVHDTGDYLKTAGGGIPTMSARTRDRLAYSMFWPIMKMQSVVDVATWLGSYWKARNREGLSDQDAIYYADAQVENSQTSGLFSDRSGIERGTLSATTRQSKWIRLWTTLVSYMLAKGNIAFEKGVALKKRPTPANVIMFLTDMILLYTMEGLAAAAIYGRWPDDEDDESFLQFAAEETALSVISGIPLLREGPSAMYGGGNTPIGSLAHDMFDLYVQIGQGEMDDTLRRKAVNVGGVFLHLPASQTNRLLDAMSAEDETEWYEYFTGPKR